MYLKTNELPEMILRSLNSIGYTKKDVEIVVTDTVSLQGHVSNGQREQVLILNMLTGDKKLLTGSWGGPNMFNTTNVVDLDSRNHTIPENGIVIKMTEGNGPMFGKIYVSKSNMILALKPTEELSQDEMQVLNVIQAYKPFARKEYLTGEQAGDRYAERLNMRRMSESELIQVYAQLQNKGLIKINRIGSVSITTEGKNASK